MAIGAYSCVPLQFGDLVVSTSAVVLESNSYDLLIGTDFCWCYMVNILYKDSSLFIMGYTVPLLFNNNASAFMISKNSSNWSHFLVKFPHGILGVPYQVATTSTCLLPLSSNKSLGLPLRADHSLVIDPLNQMVVSMGISFDVLSGMILEAWLIANPLNQEAIVAPGIQDPANHTVLKVLLLNPTKRKFCIKRHQIICQVFFTLISIISLVHFLGDMSKLGILPTIAPNDSIILAVIPCNNMFGLLDTPIFLLTSILFKLLSSDWPTTSKGLIRVSKSTILMSSLEDSEELSKGGFKLLLVYAHGHFAVEIDNVQLGFSMGVLSRGLTSLVEPCWASDVVTDKEGSPVW